MSDDNTRVCGIRGPHDPHTVAKSSTWEWHCPGWKFPAQDTAPADPVADEPDWTALAEALATAGKAMQEHLRIMGVALNAAGAAFRQAFQIATEEANEGKVPE